MIAHAQAAQESSTKALPTGQHLSPKSPVSPPLGRWEPSLYTHVNVSMKSYEWHTALEICTHTLTQTHTPVR